MEPDRLALHDASKVDANEVARGDPASSDHLGSRRRPRRRLIKTTNPLVQGIVEFYTATGVEIVESTENADSQPRGACPSGRIDRIALPEDEASTGPAVTSSLCVADIPKRYTAYPPVLFLPFNFPRQNPRWERQYAALSETDRHDLFRSIAEQRFSGRVISKIALNAPIATTDATDDDGLATTRSHEIMSTTAAADPVVVEELPNRMRIPSGLVTVYGDWGPGGQGNESNESRRSHPMAQDFDEAVWIWTSQHRGIAQCWAPLYTMFSRGNTTEKARILGLGPRPCFPGLADAALGEAIQDTEVMDLYIGIGYFALCYLARGVKRVWGWDLNPWSIEGLRRGCQRNGWPCLVVDIDATGGIGDLTALVHEVFDEDPRDRGKSTRCIAFIGDNKWAGDIMRAIRDEWQIQRQGQRLGGDRSPLNIRHANLGLLPTSKGSWESAVQVLVGHRVDGHGQGQTVWLHVHENSDVGQIESTKDQMVHEMARLTRSTAAGDEDDRRAARQWSVSCPHVEQVKSYGPGVMHCVYDIAIRPVG